MDFILLLFSYQYDEIMWHRYSFFLMIVRIYTKVQYRLLNWNEKTPEINTYWAKGVFYLVRVMVETY